MLGLLLGLSATARPDILPFVPVAAAFVGLAAWRDGWRGLRLATGASALAFGTRSFDGLLAARALTN